MAGRAKRKHNVNCIVPKCMSNRRDDPDILFVYLPKDIERRRLWLKIVGRTDISVNTNSAVCQNHFNLEDDLENYIQFKMMGSSGYKPRLKATAIPHIFDNGKPSGKSKEAKRVCVRHPNPSEEALEASTLDIKTEIIQTETHEIIKTKPIKTAILDIGKCTQCGASRKVTRDIGIQARPYIRSKFVQTTLCVVGTDTELTVDSSSVSPFKRAPSFKSGRSHSSIKEKNQSKIPFEFVSCDLNNFPSLT